MVVEEPRTHVVQGYIYKYKVMSASKGRVQSAQIRSDARDDDEALRTAHAILDYATLSGAFHIEIDVICLDERKIAWMEDGEDVPEKSDNYYLERPIRLGSGYRASND
jgi:hypothetical protein